MKASKTKNIVLPMIYILIVVATFISISLFNNLLLGNVTSHDYSKSLIKDVTQAVINPVAADNFLKPYLSDKVQLTVSYYDITDEVEKQENSLIYYENTYMPSTGSVYSSEEEFDVINVYDGVIKNISEDNILGKVIEVSHNTNLTTYYYSLKDVQLQINDEIKSGTILGKSSTNKIYTKPSLLFEVYYQGKSIDPEKFYLMKPNELK